MISSKHFISGCKRVRFSKMVQVEVTEGILEGETINNPFGGTYHSFKGIPFAEPPVGDLRFKVNKIIVTVLLI